MTPSLMEKAGALDEVFRRYGNGVVAFSGGVDSSYLLARGSKVLGEKIIAVTVAAPFYPPGELEAAKELAKSLGVRHIVLSPEVMDNEEFTSNPPDRCYYCKHGVFGAIMEVAKKEGFSYIFDGSNIDDVGQYRPGRKALDELGVKSPLEDAGLNKDDVRQLSREAGLKNWDKPPQSCLATRFPYGVKLTTEALTKVGLAEKELKKLGYRQLRLRCHGDVARLELLPEDIESAIMNHREEISRIVKSHGFSYVAVDLEGYRWGAMDEILEEGGK